MICSHTNKSQRLKLGSNNSNSLNSPPFLRFIDNLERVPLLAHHPACKYHHNHIIWAGKLPLCLGCSMMACGIVAGILLVPHLEFLTAQPFYVLLAIGVLLYIPAICQIWIQVKAYKMLARFCLGVAVVLLVYAGLWLTPWSLVGLILRVGFLGEFYLVWYLTLKIRSKHSRSPCDRCQEGRFPVCSYTNGRIPQLANQYFTEADGSDPAADEFVRALQSVYSSCDRSDNNPYAN